MKPVTQHDIAKALGISQTTVGLVVGRSQNQKGKEKLKPETIERILSKAREMGYRPHKQAQVMRQGTSMQIGMVYDGSFLQVANERASYVTQFLKQHGYQMVFYDVQWSKGNVGAVIDYMIDARVDGIILAASFTQAPEIAELRNLKLPMVGLSSADIGDRPIIRCDMRDGVLKTVHHLHEQGHRRILLVSASPSPDQPFSDWQWYQAQQAEGLQQAVQHFGGTLDVFSLGNYSSWTINKLAPNSETLCAGIACYHHNLAANSRWQPYQPGTLTARSLLESGAPLPDAIICSNDDWAFGIACELMRAGVRIPDDVAITGFNDSALASSFVVPFTSVRQPSHDICQLAVDLLVQGMQGKYPQQLIYNLPGKLVIRESSLRRRI